MNIKINDTHSTTWKVTEDTLAVNVGSGTVRVFSTPMMVALMECAAQDLLKKYIGEGETSVGAGIETSHIAATPLGMNVTAKCKVIKVDGKIVIFEIEAFDDKEVIGKGTHTRCIVNKEKFENKAYNKLKNWRFKSWQVAYINSKI